MVLAMVAYTRLGPDHAQLKIEDVKNTLGRHLREQTEFLVKRALDEATPRRTRKPAAANTHSEDSRSGQTSKLLTINRREGAVNEITTINPDDARWLGSSSMN